MRTPEERQLGIKKSIRQTREHDEVELILDEVEEQREELSSELFPSGVSSSEDMVKEFLNISEGVYIDD